MATNWQYGQSQNGDGMNANPGKKTGQNARTSPHQMNAPNQTTAASATRQRHGPNRAQQADPKQMTPSGQAGHSLRRRSPDGRYADRAAATAAAKRPRDAVDWPFRCSQNQG